MIDAWELGLRLRERREQLGLTVSAAAKAIGTAQPNLSAIENGKRKITQRNLAGLVELFEMSEPEAAEFDRLRIGAEHRDWYHQYAGLFNDDFLRHLGLEHGASAIHAFESCFIPGILQTRDYAHALFRSGSPYVRLTEVEPRLEARMVRAARLDGAEPLSLFALLSEAALRQRIGGPEVMRAQLDHLAAAIGTRDNVDVRVLPFEAGAYPALGGAFYVMSFASPTLPAVVYQETLTYNTFIDQRHHVREYTVALAETTEQALDSADSLALIRSLSEGMK
ncbi:helix-turn-helix domain-containing protein [Saccharothrix espanaensis]|uniref:helix-turn-helix domain-containing protein n=1 Tax=Saccharothrix espanaensis TaxID=103731 RepID=UPI0002D44231|nr:helix-turn-helix transcriptional regulator [Saccharothrix espanaensis]